MQRIEPNHVVARGWRSVVLIAMGRSEEALAELDQGIALDPNGRDIAFLLRQKCKAYSFLGRYEKAIPMCEKSATDRQFMYLSVANSQYGGIRLCGVVLPALVVMVRFAPCANCSSSPSTCWSPW